jgi:chaperonin cofactor prefoldin
MKQTLKQKVEELEKRVAELERQVQEQPEFIPEDSDKKYYTPGICEKCSN